MLRFLRGLLSFLLVIVILGGIGYIGYNYVQMQGLYPNTYNQHAQNTQAPANNNTQNAHSGMNMSPGGTGQQGITYTAFVLQSKDKLSELIGLITQAVDSITMDPYSRITVHGNANNVQTGQQGGASINIYPNASTSVNVSPPANTAPQAPDNTATAANTMTGGSGYVYDQGKLEQLHSGIFKLAQGIMLLNQLNDDLTMQSTIVESTSLGYQNYINRYQMVLRNKTKLNNAINLITDGSNLININPYASANGYQYDATYMDKLHSGIYKLAQGIIMASELNEDLTYQMARDATSAQSIYNNMLNTGNKNMTTNPGWGINLNSTSLAFVFNLILVIFIVTLILGIFGAIGQLFKGKTTRA